MERNAAGDIVLTQWFERARFEYPSTIILLVLVSCSVCLVVNSTMAAHGRILQHRPIPPGRATTPPPAPDNTQRSVASPEGEVGTLIPWSILNISRIVVVPTVRHHLETAAQRHAEDIARTVKSTISEAMGQPCARVSIALTTPTCVPAKI